VPSPPYEPHNRYGQIADKLVRQIADVLNIKFGAARATLGLRGDREWKHVVAKGGTPSVKFHAVLTRHSAVVVERGVSELYPEEKPEEAPGVGVLRHLIAELEAAFRDIEDQIMAGVVQAGSSPDLPIAYAPPDMNTAAMRGLAARSAVKAARVAGDPAGVRSAEAELARHGNAVPTARELQELIRPHVRRVAAARDSGDFGARIVAQGDLAAVFERVGAWNQAIPELRKLIGAQRRVPDHVYSFQAHARLAKALACDHQEKAARELLLTLHHGSAWRAGRELDVKTAARVAEGLALAQIECGNLDDAARALDDALVLRGRLGNPVGIGSVSYYQARLASRQGDWRSVRRHLRACAECWLELRINELAGRVYVAQAREMVDEIVARYQAASVWPSSSQVRFRAALKLVNRGIEHLNGNDQSGDTPAERASAYHLRGSVRLLLGPNNEETRRAASADFNICCAVCFDAAARGHAHGALAEIHSWNGDNKASQKHAKIAVKYLAQCGKLKTDERERLRYLIKR